MNELPLATLLSHPLGQLVVIVAVAAVTSILTVRMMNERRRHAEPPRQATPAAAPKVTLAAPAEAAIVAAISAAVYAVIGAHRIVYIATVRPGSNWTAEIRTRHHTSHAPHGHASHH